MSRVPPVRSVNGCWTCRLRKKKCDETRPACQRCTGIPLQCHYGARPEWMKDDRSMQEELNKIKAIVKAASNRKREDANKSKQTLSTRSHPSADSHREGVVVDSPELNSQSNSVTVGDSPAQSHYNASTSQNRLPTLDNFAPLQHPTSRYMTEAGLPQARDDSTHSRNSFPHVPPGESPFNSSPLQSIFRDHRETELLMHYLDHVFHLQFRFYHPSIEEGGRGWLLSLLLRTKPLYHAVLCLSAFHQKSILPRHRLEVGEPDLEDLEIHRNLALKELQLFIQQNDGKDGQVGGLRENIQILACIVEMISFELFSGGVSNWKLHLKAASALVVSIYDLDFSATSQGRQNYTRSSSYRPGPQSIYELSTSDRAALRFFSGVIIWFDVLACVSTGEQPYLYQHYNTILVNDPGIQLDRIMGCQNWPMLAIGEIASLAALGAGQQAATGTPSAERYMEQALAIKLRLEIGGARLYQQANMQHEAQTQASSWTQPCTQKADVTNAITHVFACAALFYLYNTVPSLSQSSSSGDKGLQLSRAVSSFAFLSDGGVMRGLLWPLCISGQVATSEEHRRFFRDLLRMAADDSQSFGNSSQALEILETCWMTGSDVSSSMHRLQNYVLLV